MCWEQHENAELAAERGSPQAASRWGDQASGALPLTFKRHGSGIDPYLCQKAPSTDLPIVSNPDHYLATIRNGYKHVSYDQEVNYHLELSKQNVADPGEGKEC